MSWQDERLDADEALRHFLPPESWEGKAQFRFAFTAGGEEIWLLARLVKGEPHPEKPLTAYHVLLRPEGVEKERILVQNNLVKRWLTLNEAEDFDWSMFVFSFNDQPQSPLTRFWLNTWGRQKWLVQKSFSRWSIVSAIEESNQTRPETKTFDTNIEFDPALAGIRKVEFLRLPTEDFQHQMERLWNDPKSDLRETVAWLEMDNQTRNAVAFECKKGIGTNCIS